MTTKNEPGLSGDYWHRTKGQEEDKELDLKKGDKEDLSEPALVKRRKELVATLPHEYYDVEKKPYKVVSDKHLGYDWYVYLSVSAGFNVSHVHIYMGDKELREKLVKLADGDMKDANGNLKKLQELRFLGANFHFDKCEKDRTHWD
ncbi:MAG: hypothetical protein M4579_006888 [Chaenotheca gracillima]|nr:MAG: hypothetical protein M4579_006888 [Chaenotheca gracillima]